MVVGVVVAAVVVVSMRVLLWGFTFHTLGLRL